MNPHFIFNAINSIQHYIVNNEGNTAYEYLTKFSRLVRKVLNNSTERIVRLESELEVLQMYIDFEKMRFSNRFDYHVTLDTHLDPSEIYVPTMLIQPYVENAIWHGLLPLREARKGLLNITIHEDNNLVTIIVEDNGVGRARAQLTNSQSEFPSMGMEISESRIRLISNLPGFSEPSVEVTDRYDAYNIGCGTSVKISFRYDHEYSYSR